jgi:hypothetical protein
VIPLNYLSRRKVVVLTGLIFALALIAGMVILSPDKSTGPETTAAAKAAAPHAPAATSAPQTNGGDWAVRIAGASLADFRRLAQEAMQLEDSSERVRILTDVLAAWLNRDPRDFRRYFDTLEVLAAMNDEQRALITAALKGSLTQLTAEAAMSDHVLSIVERFIAMLAKSDPEEALRWANQWLLNDARDNALVSVARETARLNSAQAIAVTASIQNQLRKMQAQAAIAEVWSETDIDAALAWVETLPTPTDRALAMNAALVTVAQTDPSLAASKLADAAHRMSRDYGDRRRADLAAAGLTEADEANDSATFREMVEAGTISPPTSPDVELLADAGRVIAARLAALDPADAVAWVESLGNNFLELKSLTGLFAGWAKTAPEAALALYNQRFRQYPEMLGTIFENWATAAPDRAASGAMTIPDPALRQVAIGSMIDHWTRTGEAEAAARFVEELPASDRTDSVHLALSGALAQTSPEAAWKQASMIADDATRYRAMKSAFAVLASERPSVAASLLPSSNLPAKYADRLREMLSATGEK